MSPLDKLIEGILSFFQEFPQTFWIVLFWSVCLLIWLKCYRALFEPKEKKDNKEDKNDESFRNY